MTENKPPPKPPSIPDGDENRAGGEKPDAPVKQRPDPPPPPPPKSGQGGKKD